MPILGAHQSIVGGYHKAVIRAKQCGCDCVQLFSRNNNQWRAKAISEDEARQFRSALAEHKISHPLIHDSYLINLASPDRALWQKSVDNFVLELCRAETLGVPFVVTHPGAFIEGTPKGGLQRVIRALNRVERETCGIKAQCLLETTAGQGTSLGWRFEELAAILAGVKAPDRLGICVDTCHTFAAGYSLAPAEAYEATMDLLDRTVGLAKIKAFHLNDSLRDRGSRVDRHAHIGRGKIGLEAFRHLLNDPRLQDIPMYLETPKGTEDGVDLDIVNLATLRSLVRP